MTPRQWKLYEYLKTHHTEFKSQYDIASETGLYNVLDVERKDFHDTRERIKMTDDIRAINDSPTIQKIVISNNKGVKIANEKEFEKFVKGKLKRVWRDLDRARKLLNKGQSHNQTRMVFNSERDFIEAFFPHSNDSILLSQTNADLTVTKPHKSTGGGQ